MSATDSLILGFWLGGALVGGVLGLIGWGLGYNSALRKVASRMRRQHVDEPDGDVPNIDQSWGGR